MAWPVQNATTQEITTFGELFPEPRTALTIGLHLGWATLEEYRNTHLAEALLNGTTNVRERTDDPETDEDENDDGDPCQCEDCRRNRGEIPTSQQQIDRAVMDDIISAEPSTEQPIDPEPTLESYNVESAEGEVTP